MEILTAEDVEFLTALANELKAQDTLATARPVFFQVREVRHEWGIDSDYADNMGAIIGNDPVACATLDEAKDILTQYEDVTPEALTILTSMEEVKAFCDKAGIACTLTGYRDSETFYNAFLTRSGYEEHMARFGYRYAEGSSLYVTHAHRNPQLARLLEIVGKFATTSD